MSIVRQVSHIDSLLLATTISGGFPSSESGMFSTYWNLWNINRNAHPEFYTNLSNAADDNYEQPHLKDSEQWEEEEEAEESPLPIPGPSGTHLRIPESEHNLDKQSSKSMSDRLERHLGTIIEEMF